MCRFIADWINNSPTFCGGAIPLVGGEGETRTPSSNTSPSFRDYSVPAQGKSIHLSILVANGLDARHALAQALRSLADTSDALRRLAEILETPPQYNLPAKESHQNGASAANGAVWPLT